MPSKLSEYDGNLCISPVKNQATTYAFSIGRCPPHWGLQVCTVLKDKFLERWIGRGGPTAWPPRSPDINPLDFFLWGYVKIEVFKSLQHLKYQITQAFAQVTVLMLDKTWKELLRRLKMLTDNRGSHVEALSDFDKNKTYLGINTTFMKSS